MTATLAGLLVAYVAAHLLLYVVHLIDSDDGPPPPVYVAPAHHTHPCWAGYDPALLAANRKAVAAEFAALRVAHIGRPPVRELVRAA